MKVRMFEGTELRILEEEVSEWLADLSSQGAGTQSRAEVKHITQSQSIAVSQVEPNEIGDIQGSHVTICVWYEPVS